MKKILRRVIAVFLTAVIITNFSFAQNPIIQTCYTADPAPLVYNDTLYLYTGHDEDNSTGFTMKDWRCFSTTDMVNWTHYGSPLSLANFSWAASDAWAGQCVYRDGKFCWYVPMTKKTGGMAIGIAVSDKPTGPFVDALGKPLILNSEIDPTVFIDDDEQAYLYWGNPDLYYVKLNENMISYSGDIIQVPLTVDGFAARKGNPNRITTFEEAPWLYKRNGIYYMTYAGGPVPEHIAYSTGPSAIGPWTYRDTIMPTQGGSFTNHQGLIDYKGNSYFFYHNGALPGGGGFTRSVCVEKFQYNTDGSIPTFNMTSGVNPVNILNPYKNNEAETMAWESGIETQGNTQTGVYVTDIDNGDYIKVRNVDFGATGAGTFTAKFSNGSNPGVLQNGTIEVHVDKIDGNLIGTLPVSYTGGWNAWKTSTTNITGVTNTHDLYFVFKGNFNKDMFNFDSWKFEPKSFEHKLSAINVLIDQYKIDKITGVNTTPLEVVAIYKDGTREDVSSNAQLTLSQQGIVKIENNVITGIEYGVAAFTAEYGGFTDSTIVIVKDISTELSVKNLQADITETNLLVGQSFQFKVNAEYYDGHTEEITDRISSKSGNTAIATITKNQIKAIAKGETVAVIEYMGEKGTTKSTSIKVIVNTRNPFIKNEAEDWTEQSGVDTENTSDSEGGKNVGWIENGDWIKISALDFGDGTETFSARVASAEAGGNIEIRLDNKTGTLVGTCPVSSTGGWQVWVTKLCPVTDITGLHDIYLIFTGNSGFLFNMNWWQFNRRTTGIEKKSLKKKPSIEIEGGNRWLKGIQKGYLITIFDISGRSIYNSLASNEQLLLPNLKGGIYIVNVEAGEEATSFKVEF